MFITILSWKNIWRNKTRSFIIIGAIAIGLFAGAFIASFITGWMQRQVESDIHNQISYIQIHHENFLNNYDLSDYFLRSQIEPVIQSDKGISHVSYRLKIVGMLASAANAVGLHINAVDVPEEMKVSSLYTTIPDSCGSFFQDNKEMRIVISRRTAEKLKVKLNSKVVVNFQNLDGETVSLAFRIGGIFKTTNSIFDEGNVFIDKRDVAALTGLPADAAHEAAIMITIPETCNAITQTLKQQLPGMDVKDWKELNPMLKLSDEWQSMMSMVILGIFLLALAFGIINTMLMAVLERTRELGMLMAIGMNKRKIFNMIMTESLLLTMAGGIIGMALAALVIALTTKSGINLSFMMGDNFEDYGFGSLVYPAISVGMFIQITILTLFCGIISAIYPARKALKLNPLEAVNS